MLTQWLQYVLDLLKEYTEREKIVSSVCKHTYTWETGKMNDKKVLYLSMTPILEKVKVKLAERIKRLFGKAIWCEGLKEIQCTHW